MSDCDVDVRMAIVEDDATYRELIVELCRACEGVTIVGVFSCLRSAVEAIPRIHADLALVDLGLPDGEGADLIAQLRSACRTECLALTVFEDDDHLFRALKCGAVGYLLKEAVDLSSLRSAITEVMSGGAPMSHGIARRILSSFHRTLSATQALPPLTGRELEILDQLAQGQSAKRISHLLGIAYETVRCHQKSIYRKLQVNSVVEAVALAYSWGRSRAGLPLGSRRAQ